MAGLNHHRVAAPGFFRFAVLVLGIAGVYSLLIFHLFHLQIEQGTLYAIQADKQHLLAGELEPARGRIYFTDKNGNSVQAAISRSYPIVYAVPKKIEDAAKTAASLAPILDVEIKELEKQLGKKDDPYELLASRLSEDKIEAVDALNIKGIDTDRKDFRFYPLHELAAHILGYVGPVESGGEFIGRYGVEFYKESELKGRPGKVGGGKLVKPESGQDLALTIDRDIQAQAEKILKDLVATSKAQGGSVIVEEPATGKILALGNYPAFDPNRYWEFEVGRFLNPVSQAIYEPGSVFKVITIAAALDSGRIIPQTEFFDGGSLTIDGKTIKNWDLLSHGRITPVNILEKSINVGAALVEKELGHENFYQYLVKFGFDEVTGVELPEELAGNLKNLKAGRGRSINFATAAFGQGIAVTPLELISAVAAIANQGVLLRPQLIDQNQPEIVRQVISAEAAGAVTEMMVSALRKAEIGHIPRYRLAGKTGTAQVADLINGGYTGEVINTYVGFGPVKKPRFIILIKLDKPAGAPLAGQTVVPAFRELAQFILNYYNIPPDDL